MLYTYLYNGHNGLRVYEYNERERDTTFELTFQLTSHEDSSRQTASRDRTDEGYACRVKNRVKTHARSLSRKMLNTI